MSLPPLLSLPVEIRLRIYELAHNATFLVDRLVWPTPGFFTLHLHGSTDNTFKTSGSPFTLLRVCRTLHNELSPLLPPLSSVRFHFADFSTSTLESYLSLMSEEQVAQIRRLLVTGTGNCQLRHVGEGTRCERSLHVDLSVFERELPKDRERYERTLDRADNSRYNRQFYKGFYLLRVREDCVRIPKAKSHPSGTIGQCNSVVDQQDAIAGLVKDDGEVNVTREGLGELLGAVMTDEIPGGPGRRHLE